MFKIIQISDNFWNPQKFQFSFDEATSNYSENFLIQYDLMVKHTSGVFSFTPMGWLIKENIEILLDQMMNELEYVKTQLSNITPLSMWKLRDLSDETYIQGQDIFSPTSEELVMDYQNKRHLKNIKIYQHSSPFRNEIRPQMGLYRTKNFWMKDAYGYFSSDSAALQEFNKAVNAYVKFFDSLRIPYHIKEFDEDGKSIEIWWQTNHTGKLIEEKFYVEIANLFLLDYVKNGISFGIGTSRMIQCLVDICLKKVQEKSRLVLPEIINPFECAIISTSHVYDGIAKNISENIDRYFSSKYNFKNIFLDISDKTFGEKIFNWNMLGTRYIVVIGKHCETQELEIHKLNMETFLYEISHRKFL